MNCLWEDHIWQVHAAQVPEIVASWLQDMYLQLNLVLKQPRCFSANRAKTVQTGGKNADKRPDKGQVSVIAQENLKLAAFLFHQRWRCTFDWEEMGVWEDTVYLLASQKRLNKITRTQMCCLKSIGLTWQVQWRPSESTLGHVMVSWEHFLHQSLKRPL